MKRARLLLISLFNFCILVAQPTYQIKHYSVNDGMSQGIVQTIIQDKKRIPMVRHLERAE